jgi:flagellar biosynthesis anti-sigma factor FlgM
LNQETVRSVVTSLQRDKQQVEPDIDLDELRAALDELPTINATKVVSLHRRIVNGDYKVDSERLAEKLMELEASLDRD